MNGLAIVFIIKIGFTLVLWCLPLLMVPEILLIKLGLPKPSSMLFLRLLGMAYLALTVGYGFGLIETLNGGHPRDIVLMGIISNGGACLILLINGVFRSWQAWGPPAQFMMWFSLIATGGIALGLVVTGFI